MNKTENVYFHITEIYNYNYLNNIASIKIHLTHNHNGKSDRLNHLSYVRMARIKL